MPALPLLVLSVLVVAGAAIVSMAGLLLVHRYVWRPDPGTNEVPGFFYAVIGVICGVMLAFIVLVVWERFAATDAVVVDRAPFEHALDHFNALNVAGPFALP